MGGTLRKTFTDPLSANNPVTIQILGICSALAVTVQLRTAIVMAIALTTVTAGSNAIISLMRRSVPTRIRLIVEMVVVSTLVIIADQFLRAYLYDISRQLSVFVGLIITNCIVLGRMEGYALQNPPLPALLDGLGNGCGYGAVLVLVAFVREILGSGRLFGQSVLPSAIPRNGLALLAPGAFIVLGLLIWTQRTLTRHYENE
jgi:Na+-transporting NADH:ubiquinone oxidoreductase subunit D